MDEYTVGEVARMAHVSVRTLHHYDAIGLLPPSGRSASRYRLYTDTDLQRLQQIRFYRELEFPLEQIAEILADPGSGPDDHLRRQHRMLRARAARAQELLDAIEHQMEARQMGISLTPQEQFEIFGTDRLEEHAAEAEQRWGDSDMWKESKRRTAAHTKEDWLAIKAEVDENIAAFKALVEAGEPATGAAAMDLAEAHRAHLTRWFYACDHGRHAALADLYVSDPRFTTTWDDVAPGFARYVHDAIKANAERAA